MVKPFSKSKRTPVRLRHKIEKASSAKKRKDRKTARQDPQWRSRLKKDPGIPNLFPYKDKILEEIEEKKRKKAEDAQRLRDAAKSKKNAGKNVEAKEVQDEDEEMDEDEGDLLDEQMEDDNDDAADSSNPMAALLASAQVRAADYGSKGDIADDNDEDKIDGGVQVSNNLSADNRNPDSSRKAFDKIFKQVLEAADVILYVLDARDPEGTRSREVERQIIAAQAGEKRLVLVLNKIDLVPAEVLAGWLKHLRRYFPTTPLRASTPASNAQTFDHKQYTIKNTSETLLRSLKSYAASKQLKRSISVGVIGYPNVGKSSVINALTSRLNKGAQSFACPVGSEAGVTTALREIKIDSKLKVLDSPGIVFPAAVNDENKEGKQKRKSEHEARLVLLNALPPAQVSDPEPAIKMLLERMSASPALYEKLLQHYGIVALGPFGQGDTTTDFLVQVARRRGRLGKGGVPNLNAAAMTVITDWRDGRIQGWVEPPVLKIADDTEMADGATTEVGPSADQKIIVKEWAEEFKLDGLWDGTTDG